MHLTQEVLVLIICWVKVKTWKTFILVLASTVIKVAFLIVRRRTFIASKKKFTHLFVRCKSTLETTEFYPNFLLKSSFIKHQSMSHSMCHLFSIL